MGEGVGGWVSDWNGGRAEKWGWEKMSFKNSKGGFLSISASFCPISAPLPAVQTPVKPNKAWKL